MILTKISDSGELECNFEEILELSNMYDAGHRTDETYKAKVLVLVYLKGFAQGVRQIEEEGKNLYWLMSHTAGNA